MIPAIVLVLAACAFGIVVGRLRWASEDNRQDLTRSSPEPASPAAPAEGLPNRFNVLIVFLDHGQHPARVQGVWTLMIMPSARNLYLKGLPYDLWLDFPDGTAGRLCDVYAHQPDDEPAGDQLLHQTLESFLGDPIDRTLVIDQSAFDELATQLAPLEISGVPPDTRPRELWRATPDSLETLQRQEMLQVGLLQAMSRLATAQKSIDFHDSVQRTGRTNLTPKELLEMFHFLGETGSDHRFVALLDGRQVEPFVAPDGLTATRIRAGTPGQP